MERRTALTAAATAAFSVLAIGAAITTNLRPDDAKASTSSDSLASTATTVGEPRIVTIVVPAPDADRAPASASPLAAPASAGTVLADDHGRDAADELGDEDRHELDERDLEHEAEHHDEVEHEVEDD